MSQDQSVSNDKGQSSRALADQLANERTHLAWLRTALSVSAFGIAINRFNIYLSELGIDKQRARSILFLGPERVGTLLAVLGPIVMIWSAVRYARVQRALLRGAYVPGGLQVWSFTLVLVALTAACTMWLSPP